MIPGLPQVGPMELLILLSVILLFFGAKRIPDLARSLGSGVREFREGISAGAADEDGARDLEEDEDKPAPLEDGADRGETPQPEVEPARSEQGS